MTYALVEFGDSVRDIQLDCQELLRLSVGADWFKTFLAKAKPKVEEIKTTLFAEHQEAITDTYLESTDSFQMELPDPELFPASYSLAIKYNEGQRALLAGADLTHVALCENEWSGEFDERLAVDLYGDSISVVIAVPIALALRLKSNPDYSVAIIPASVSAERLKEAIETVKVLHQPNGNLGQPYSHFATAFEAALKV